MAKSAYLTSFPGLKHEWPSSQAVDNTGGAIRACPAPGQPPATRRRWTG